MVAGTTGFRDSWPLGSMGCRNEPMVGMGCSNAALCPLVCFLPGLRKLGGGFDAAFVVVGKRMESQEVAS
jgi:hypothetical protein